MTKLYLITDCPKFPAPYYYLLMDKFIQIVDPYPQNGLY